MVAFNELCQRYNDQVTLDTRWQDNVVENLPLWHIATYQTRLYLEGSENCSKIPWKFNNITGKTQQNLGMYKMNQYRQKFILVWSGLENTIKMHWTSINHSNCLAVTVTVIQLQLLYMSVNLQHSSQGWESSINSNKNASQCTSTKSQPWNNSNRPTIGTCKIKCTIPVVLFYKWTLISHVGQLPGQLGQ